MVTPRSFRRVPPVLKSLPRDAALRAACLEALEGRVLLSTSAAAWIGAGSNLGDANTSAAAAPDPSTTSDVSIALASVAATAPVSVAPTGSVKFKDGNTVLATVALDSNGLARYTPASLSVGSHSITAVYVSDSNTFSGSTSPVRLQTVSRASTAIS